MPRLKSLDGVRGCAALIVLFHHTGLASLSFEQFMIRSAEIGGAGMLLFFPPLRLFFMGHEAVLIFFILSGVVLALPWSAGRPPGYMSYMVKRVFRIYVPYLVAIYLAFTLAAIFAPIADPQQSTWFNLYGWPDLDLAPRHWVDALWMGTSSFNADNPVWSLAWEMRISAIFPLIAWPVVKWKTPAALLLIAACLLINCLGFGLPSPVVTLIWWSMFFVAGIWIAVELRPIATAVSTLPRYLVIILVCAALVLIGTDWELFVGASMRVHELISGIGAFIIICAALDDRGLRRFFETAPCLWLGDISFSLYLVHVPVIMLVLIFVKPQNVGWISSGASIVLSLMVAIAFNRLIERSSQRAGRLLSDMLSSREMPSNSTSAVPNRAE